MALPDMAPESNGSHEPSFAFYVHSQQSFGHNSPPDIDNQRLARQKRRRTSPEDQAILEAEYESNSKPDKIARQEIVERVALGEKEVQARRRSYKKIWFQNRRQMTRRKSKPTTESELDVGILSSQENPSADSQSFDLNFTSSQPPLSSSQSSTGNGQASFSLSDDSNEATKDASLLEAPTDGNATRVGPSSDVGQVAGLYQNFKLNGVGAMRPREPADIGAPVSPGVNRPGYFANRRSALFMIHDDGEHVVASTKYSELKETENYMNTSRIPKSVQPLQRSASLVKLSFDAEGKAEVTARTGETPSPPHPRSVLVPMSTRRPGLGLQRSFSAVDRSTYGKKSPEHKPSKTGRSRDARTWEFYCDSDARDALTKQAEREESGSATAAIGLIRSRSQNNKTLTPNANKRNAHLQKQESAKRHKIDREKSSKPKLGRTTSSVGRLQTSTSNVQKVKPSKTFAKHRKSNSQSAIFEDFDGDSDKENWEPGTQTRRPPRRRPVNPAEHARILLESLREPSESSSLGAVLGRGNSKQRQYKPKLDDKDYEGPEIDDEIAAFMGEETLPREEEDLDCVQNLLRLSQAAWT